MLLIFMLLILSPSVRDFYDLHSFFLSQGNLVLVRDFNCTYSELDRFNLKTYFSGLKVHLPALKSDFCLASLTSGVSVIHVIGPIPGPLSPCRRLLSLIVFFISRSLVSSVFSCDIRPCDFSDMILLIWLFL